MIANPQLLQSSRLRAKAVSAMLLDSYIGLSIAGICPCGFSNPGENHCAHAVSHILGFNFGYTCNLAVSYSPVTERIRLNAQQGASVRVQEIFPRCPEIGIWSERPERLAYALVFAVKGAGNVDVGAKSMINVRAKHVGVGNKDSVWHYSNSQDRWIFQSISAFSRHYGPATALFWGSLPQ